MVKTGVLIAALFCCVLVIVGTILGVWGSNIACPDFGADCGAPSPGPAPAPAPAPARTPTTTTPSASPSPSVATPTRSPGLASSPTPALGSLGSTPDAAATPVNLGTPVAAAPVAPTPTNVVNCVGQWGSCDKDCGTDGVKTYSVTTPAQNGGTPCKDGSNIVTTGSQKSCGDLGPCGRNCEGNWVITATTDANGWSQCPACGPGNQTRTWRNDPNKTQIPPGSACLHGEGYTETRNCTNQPACVVPVNCVGSWGAWSGCSVGCGSGGTRSKTYTITTNASNGGTACIDPDDGTTNLSTNVSKRVKSGACDPVPPMCCNDVSGQVGPWVDGGGDCGTNNPYGRPYRYQSRALISGATANQADVSRCGFEIVRTLLTARGCPNQSALSVTCSSGGSWDGTKCTVTPSGGSCPSGYNYNSGATSGAAACSYTKSCAATTVASTGTCPACTC